MSERFGRTFTLKVRRNSSSNACPFLPSRSILSFMVKYCIIIFLMLVETMGVWFINEHTLAEAPLAKKITIEQIKISGGEFVILKNNTDSEQQLSDFWLIYFNEASLAVGVSSSSSQLPDAKLKPNKQIILTSDLAPICGPVMVAKLPFALKDSAGMMQVVAIGQNGSVVGYQPQDQANWSNAKTGNSADIKLPSSQDPRQLWFKNASKWQSGLVDYSSGCQESSDGTPQNTGETSEPKLNGAGTSPPYVVLGAQSSPASLIAASNNGLSIPQLSEILPNPAPPQTDEKDEFIELYNPNDKPFDLSNFILQAGVMTLHDFTFKKGTTIGANEFKAFSRSETKITLSNSEGQVKLLDPSGKELVAAAAYESAKDGQAWVFAEEKWQWSTAPTPGSVNKLSQPETKDSKKTVAAASSSLPGSSSSGNTPAAGQSSSSPTIHPAILAAVGLAALLYAGYEYRNDLGNFIYRLRRNRTPRGTVGPIS